MKKYFSILIIILPFIFFSCAHIGSPAGGPQDSVPPTVMKSSPEYKDTGFTGKQLIFKFDEFFQYKDIISEFFSSPPFAEIPEFSISGKKMIIKLKEELKDTTTYTFYFGNSIQDFNENNPIEDFTFVFSTGSVVDSFSVSGYVYNAMNLEKSESVYVMLYKSNFDSIPYLETPYFVAKTDTSGYFHIQNIKPGKYKLFGLNDMNTNMLYDMPNESVGFLDTNINATVKTIYKIDTLINKSYIYDSLNVVIIDSLFTDSIVENIFYEYSPDNLRLFLFDENNNKQFISEAVRAKKGKVMILFNTEIKDTFSLKPLNFVSPNSFIETFPENDSLIYWLNDTSLLNLDTLKIEFTYWQVDSAFNYFIEQDTVNLSFDNKDADSIFMKLETNITSDFDFYEDVVIETGTPVKLIDTTKIKLYQIIDSMVLIDKTQKILKSERHQKDLLVFTFEQPLLNNPEIEILNVNFSKEDYQLFINEKRDSVSFKLLDSKIYENEVLAFLISYDNQYYFEQYQQFKDRKSLKINSLNVTDKKRNFVNEMFINFNKNITDDFVIKILNSEYEINWYSLDVENSIAKITILDSVISVKDTLILSLNTIDYIDFDNKPVEFSDTISMILTENKQEITNKYRDLSSHFVLEFKKPLIEEPLLKLVDSELDYWCRSDFKENATKVEYEIYHQGTRNIKELEVIVNYTDIDKYGNLIQIEDMLQLVESKKFDADFQDSVEVSIEYKTDFEIKSDSSHLRKYIIDFEKKPDTKYVLEIDSLAFTDIFEMGNDTLISNFKTRKTDYYGNLVLNITNLGAIKYNNIEINQMSLNTRPQYLDSTLQTIDSISQNIIIDTLNEGQAILYIIDPKGEILYQFNIKNSQVITLTNLLPQTLLLKILYDKNSNGKWDTGNYLKKFQPEKMFFYSKSTSIQSGFDTEVDWKLETY
jgi:hypothetical protein